jgi:hypothetical protein
MAFNFIPQLPHPVPRGCASIVAPMGAGSALRRRRQPRRSAHGAHQTILRLSLLPFPVGRQKAIRVQAAHAWAWCRPPSTGVETEPRLGHRRRMQSPSIWCARSGASALITSWCSTRATSTRCFSNPRRRPQDKAGTSRDGRGRRRLALSPIGPRAELDRVYFAFGGR